MDSLLFLPIRFFLLLAGLLFISSCGTFSSMQTGRTVDQGNAEIGVAYYRPSTIINALRVKDGKSATNFRLGYFHVNARYGITDRIEAGINLNTYGQIGLEGKYQLVGDKESLFALSLGATLNTFFFYYYEYQIPVHMSVHPIGDLAIYFTPKYAGQFVSALGISNIAYMHYAGFSGGIMYGDRTKVGIEYTYMDPLRKVLRQDVFPAINNYGIGVKFTIGGNRDESPRRKSGNRF